MKIQKKCGITKKIPVWTLEKNRKHPKGKVVKRMKKTKVCLVKKLPKSGKPQKGWTKGTI